jgi:hypothetical protein
VTDYEAVLSDMEEQASVRHGGTAVWTYRPRGAWSVVFWDQNPAHPVVGPFWGKTKEQALRKAIETGIDK